MLREGAFNEGPRAGPLCKISLRGGDGKGDNIGPLKDRCPSKEGAGTGPVCDISITGSGSNAGPGAGN